MDYFSFGFILITCLSSTVLAVRVFPKIKSGFIGSNATFSCIDKGSRDSTFLSTHASPSPIRWLGPDLEVIGSSVGRIRVERINGSFSILYVTQLRWADQGRYRCTRRLTRVKRSHGLSNYEEAESRLSILDPVDGMTHQSPSINAQVGSDVTLPCFASTHVDAKWFFRSKQITSGEKHVVTDEGLHIKESSQEDDGVYECRIGWKFQNIRLIVLSQPSIERLLIPAKIIRGHNVTISCQVLGNVNVQFQWTKEQRVSDMVRVKKKLKERSEHLHLGDVTTDDDGKYFCLVTNSLGSDERSVNLKVMSPPEITSMPERVTAVTNRSVEVVCGVEGFPRPSIEWRLSTFHGESLQSPEDLRRHGVEVIQGHRIIINTTNKSLSGNMTCFARNEAGSSSRTSMLIVEHEPSASVSPHLAYGWPGETRKLKCSSVAFPLATLIWFHDDFFLDGNHHHHHQISTNQVSVNSVESVLTISIPDKASWIYGNYTCIAKNIHGHSTGSMTLVHASAPEAPRNISILEENPHEVIISAGTHNNNPLQPISWSVTYEEQRHDSKQQREIFSFGEQIILKNLKPSTEYTVHLSLRNAVGYGQSTKFKLHTPAKDSKNVPKQAMFSKESNEKMHVSDASSSGSDISKDFESKFSSMKKTKKKLTNLEGSNHMIWAIVTGLVLTIASSITTACFCTAWRQRNRKCQNTSDILSLRGQINSPIPPNSILLVPVSNNDQNGQPILTNDDVETLASELASLSQDTPIKTLTSELQCGTFPRHFKHSKEKLNCFSPIFTPASSNRRKAVDVVDLFGAQFRKIQPETFNAHSFTPAKKAHNFVSINLDCNNEHYKRFIPNAESSLRKNSANESFSTCGGYKSADNVDDDIDSVDCNTPCHRQYPLNRTFQAESGDELAFAYHPHVIRSMSQLK